MPPATFASLVFLSLNPVLQPRPARRPLPPCTDVTDGCPGPSGPTTAAARPASPGTRPARRHPADRPARPEHPGLDPRSARAATATRPGGVVRAGTPASSDDVTKAGEPPGDGPRFVFSSVRAFVRTEPPQHRGTRSVSATRDDTRESGTDSARVRSAHGVIDPTAAVRRAGSDSRASSRATAAFASASAETAMRADRNGPDGDS